MQRKNKPWGNEGDCEEGKKSMTMEIKQTLKEMKVLICF